MTNSREKGPDLNALLSQFVPMIQMWLASKGGTAPAPTASPVRRPADPASDERTESAPRNAAVPSPIQTAHLLAIYGLLAPREQRITQRAVSRMPDEQRAEWLGKVTAMSPEDVAALVRSMIEDSQPRTAEPKASVQGEVATTSPEGSAP